MSDSGTQPLTQADALIEVAWGHPVDELEARAPRRPVDDPLLRAAMHVRASLAIESNSITVHQERLHALTWPGHVPAFYDLQRITDSANGLRAAYAESHTALQAIRHIIEAREAAGITDRVPAPAVRLTQAAVARSGLAPRVLGQSPGQPALSAAVGPVVASASPRR